ncbi:MAG: response regulator transcription factor [Candidatus Obscuribacterales bacterium]|nr:response regulator transcription factor [Candidatus Obscuribacterales bacterium]
MLARELNVARVLVIEDDLEVAQALELCLKLEGHTPEMAFNGREGFELLKFGGYDLAIVDWQLPELDGDEICSNYRITGGKTPILMLTKKSTIRDKVAGLDSGADDYLPKPFDIHELTARVRALLRRSTNLFDGSRARGRVRLDYAGRTVTIDQRTAQLVKREFDLFEFLLRHPGTYFTTEQLIKHVWGSSAEVGDEALRVCINRLRTKVDIDGEPSVIENAKGWGYKISDGFLD